MAVQSKALSRVFKYNGMTLPCPGINHTPERVKQIYAMSYPELTNAIVDGPVTKAGMQTYTFTRAAGAKG